MRNVDLEKEIERLNNIIYELEKYLNYRLQCSIQSIRDDEIRKILNKLQELKEKK